jgi:hypothetical protein
MFNPKMLGGLTRKIFISLLFVCANAFAAPTQYLITGTGSGSLGGSSFDNQAFSISMIGDPFANPMIIDPLGSAQVSITGLGTTSLSFSTRLGLNSGNGVVFFSRSGGGGLDLFDFYVAPGSLTNLVGPFGPLAGNSIFALEQFQNVESSLGSLSFNSASNVAFQALAVPEPETYAMLMAGLGLLGFMARRKNKHSA